jgi:hypothetical protein
MKKRTTPYKYINLHHTAGEEEDVQKIRKSHMSPPRNYGDIGYNSLIGTDGKVTLGRSTEWEGAHNPGMSPDRVHSMNAVAYSVSFIGNFEESFMGEVQFRAGVKFIAGKCTELGLKPSQITLRPHKADYATLCPGKNFPYERMVSEIAKLMEGGRTLKNVIVFFSSGDYSAALAVANQLGFAPMICRNGQAVKPPDAMNAEKVFTVGGPALGHPNEVYMSGQGAIETMAEVSKKHREGKLI